MHREEDLIAVPQSFAEAMGECAGDIGQHGKWMDVMIPFIRKCVSKNKTGGGGRAAERGDTHCMVAPCVLCVCFRPIYCGDSSLTFMVGVYYTLRLQCSF